MKLRAAIAVLTAFGASAATPSPQVSVHAPPVLLMVRAATTPTGERREKKLYEELSLALDSFVVISMPAEHDGFANLPLAEQMAAVLPQAHENGAIAVVWMSFPLPKQVMVHLVVLGSGRALVRTIEADRTSESGIALIARELLGTAYLFEPAASLPAEVTEVVHTVKDQIAAAETAAPDAAPEPAPPPRLWELWGSVAFRYAVAGGADAVPYGQLSLGAARALGNFHLGANLDAGFSSVSRPNTTGAQFFVAGASLVLSYGFGIGTSQYTLGPRLAAGADWGTFFAGAKTLGQVLPRVSLGLEARTRRPGPGFAVVFGGVYSPLGAELDAADSSPLYRTPNVELELAVAFGWEGL